MEGAYSTEYLPKPASVMIIGGGIGGMRSALDLADAGLKVYLIESTPGLGGRVAQLGYMFPQHDCVLCRGTPDHGYGCTRPSISPAYIEHNQHPNIEILTNTHVLDIAGQAGDFTISLRQNPRYVNPSRCINCGLCADVCPVQLPDQYQQGMTLRKAAYKISVRAVPDAYVIDRGPYCSTCGKCAQVCPSKAIDLNETPRLFSLHVGAIILAFGFQAYDPSELQEYGYRRYPNVITSMEYERLASRSGPTEGIITRPSDQKHPQSIAWLQCVGSRDKNHAYCSSICCMVATKEAMLAKQRLGQNISCQVFLMDERAFNKEYATYFERARRTYNIQYTRCRVSSVLQDPNTGNLIVQYTDINGQPMSQIFDMVVLATGLQPPESARQFTRLLDLELNEYGFCRTDKFTPLQTSHSGVFVCGAFTTPKEISETILDASGAAGEVMRLLNERLNTYTFSREQPFLWRDNLPAEKTIEGQPPRIGFFACSCGGTMSAELDLKALVKQAQALPSVIHSELVEFACFPETTVHIQQCIRELELNRLVVAACSNRTHDSLFQRVARQEGINPYLVELVNLREQCSRVHYGQHELARRKSRELLRMALERVRLARPIYKQRHRCRSSALVIGGGLAGMTVALAIADSGYTVHLIEKSEVLGGNLQNMYYVAEGYNPRRLGRDLINRARAHPRITALTRTELARYEGHVGFFRSELHTLLPDQTIRKTEIEHGVTIVATGGYEAREHPWLTIPGVITQREFEEKVIHSPAEIASLKNVIMIQCVHPPGSKEYCSRVCCTNTMKNAIRLKLFNPGCQVSVLYKNIVTYGFREEYYNEARRLGVVFIRYTDDEKPEILSDDRHTRVRIRDLALKRWLDLPADLVLLSMAILPAPDTPMLARLLRVPLSSEGFFEEAQIKLRPMDFMREGIFLAGMAHYPKFIEETISHALAAAARAVTLLSQGGTLYLGSIIAEVDPQKCVGCLTCTRTCPFGIPQVIQEEGRTGVGGLGGAAYIDPAQCQGCGTCTGECPANAIQLRNYYDEQIMMREIAGLGRWLPIGEERL